MKTINIDVIKLDVDKINNLTRNLKNETDVRIVNNAKKEKFAIKISIRNNTEVTEIRHIISIKNNIIINQKYCYVKFEGFQRLVIAGYDELIINNHKEFDKEEFNNILIYE